MKISGIYSITQISTGKRYIGSSTHIHRRWNSHKSALNRNICDNIHLQNSWNKYGELDFLFEILESGTDADILEESENSYIIKYGIYDTETNSFCSKKGFNMCWAGRTGCVSPENIKSGKDHHLYGKVSSFKGRHHTSEAKNKISEARAGITNREYTTASAETKRKMSESKKNKPWTDARRAAQNKRKQGVLI